MLRVFNPRKDIPEVVVASDSEAILCLSNIADYSHPFSYLNYGELKFAVTYLKSKNNRNIIMGAHTMRDKFLIIKISDWKVAAIKCLYSGKYNNDSRGFLTSDKGI